MERLYISPLALRAMRLLSEGSLKRPLRRCSRRSVCRRHAASRCMAERHPPSKAGLKGLDSRTDASGLTCRSICGNVVPYTVRGYATESTAKASNLGPIAEYESRLESGRIREDEHQRTIVQYLQDLHDMLKTYNPPPVVHPNPSAASDGASSSHVPKFLQAVFGSRSASTTYSSSHPPDPPPNMPKGLYMYGDVGSGKTMLMDLFYDTLPANITARLRIHFHEFMQDVHRRLHALKSAHGESQDAIAMVAADIAEKGRVLCFDEFQCTDVADAMILRRLLESLMSHGVVLVTTSNRPPQDLYLNGIQRASFLPCIALLQSRLRVLALESHLDYRRVPRPPAGAYHHPLDASAPAHAERWFRFLGDFEDDPPHAETVTVWGRTVQVPRCSGRATLWTFKQLLGGSYGAGDYLAMVQRWEAFVVTGVPAMSYNERDLARRFITFIDTVYESRGKLILTTATPLPQLFLSPDEIAAALAVSSHPQASSISTSSNPTAGNQTSQSESTSTSSSSPTDSQASNASGSVEPAPTPHPTRNIHDDLQLDQDALRRSGVFDRDEERFAFARALSRLQEMGSRDWIERGLGMEKRGGKQERETWSRMRSRWREDSM